MASPPPDPAKLAAQMAALREFNIEAFTLLGIALVITGMRTCIRIQTVGLQGFQADDVLVLFGATFHGLETGLAYCVGNIAHGLANNAMTPEQRSALDPNSEEFELRVLGSKIQLMGWTCYSLLLWCLKGAMCSFYLRLTDGLSGYRTRIYIGFFFIGGTWIAAFLNLMLSCRPLPRMWQIQPDPGQFCYPAISPAVVWTFLALNVVTDLYLISIPLPMLFKAAMPRRKKAALIALFSCGLFVVMAAILRVALLVTDPENGAQLAGSWAVRETFVAVITTNLPMIFPLLRRKIGPIIGTLTSTMGGSRRGTGSRKAGGLGSSSLPATHESFGARGRGPPRSNPLTNVTYTESEERIVEEHVLVDLSQKGVESEDSNANPHRRASLHSATSSTSAIDPPRTQAQGQADTGPTTHAYPKTGIQRQVSVVVSTEEASKVSSAQRGDQEGWHSDNGIRSWTMVEGSPPQRGEHTHSGGYRNV